MVTRFDTFDRDLKFATADLSEEAISAGLAAYARSELAKVIASGEASSSYTRFVNGQEGVSEDSVIAPGPIMYEFAWWDAIITAALAELAKRSPKKSGRYASSFVVLANQVPVTSFDDIPGDAEVIIFNAQPYTRKVEVGAMTMTVAPHHFDATNAVLRAKFGAKGAFRIITRFLDIKEGIDPRVPYRLKGHYAGRRNAQVRAIRAGAAIPASKRLRRRQDMEVGKPITYPALVINMVH